MDPEALAKMDEHLKQQNFIGTEIENLIKNYKKTPLDRRTLTFYGKRLKQLLQLKRDFQDNDAYLAEIDAKFKMSEYYTNNYFAKIMQVAEDCTRVFDKEIKTLAPALDVLYQQQAELAVKMDKLISDNQGKTATQATKAFWEKLVRDLEALLSEFDANDSVITLLAGINQSHEYFRQQKFDIMCTKTRNAIKQFKQLKEAALTTMANNGTPSFTTLTLPNLSNNDGQVIDAVKNTIRRQDQMISSLNRLINASTPEGASAAAADLKASESLFEKIQELHFSIWETQDDPISKGYNLTAYFDLEEKMRKFRALAANQSFQQHQDPYRQPSAISNVPLPKINIPKFDGNYTNWATFSDLFSKVVHEQHIAPVQKFWYLKTLLSGEAERLIRHLALTDNNYDTAWSMLQNRYCNKRLVTSTIIQQILDHPNITSDAASIKGFHDVVKENLAALENLELDISSWDAILLQILIKKLDRHTHTLYESSLKNPKELQKVDDFLSFMEQRFQALESMGPKDKSKKDSQQNQSKNKVTSATVTSSNCKVCDNKGHAIYYCSKFLKMTPKERSGWVQANKLCLNCFKPDHRADACESRSCKTCSKKHNSLLHFESKSKGNSKKSNTSTSATVATEASDQTVVATTTTPMSATDIPVATIAASGSHNDKYVFLATAKIRIRANNGRTCEARAVLDSASQTNLISQRLINKMSLSTTKAQLAIEGVGLQTGHSKSRVNVSLESLIGNFSTRFEAYVIPQIVSAQPSRNIDISNWKIPANVELADPLFHLSEKVDVLIGAEHFLHFLKMEQIDMGPSIPPLQNTVLGWVFLGETNSQGDARATCAIFTTEEERISDLIEKFWKTEELNDQKEIMSKPEQLCEDHFLSTVSRNEEGRFVVSLPFADDPSTLGNSRAQAERRFESLERRLKTNPDLQKEYKRFMDEYEALGHMEKIREEDIPAANYFIPHHCVLKPDSTTTKLRVVFDASAKTSTGVSLNDILHKGPTVQSELFSILLRFRIHRFVFTADIEKMYRQILIDNKDTAHQLIVWRSKEAENYQYYRLKTVTYGTTSAPYLATKCLQYLATQNLVEYPLGAPAIRDDFYVDDCLSGANEITIAQEMQKQIKSLLHQAGFKLRKWCANHSQLLSGIPMEDKEINLDLEDTSNQTIKTLGIIWMPKSDQLCGRAHIPVSEKITKRIVSSDLARVFDPLGIFAPITVTAKIFMQQLWELKIDWDQELPMQLQQQWLRFREELEALNNLKIRRHVFHGEVPTNIQIHTFVDASEKAFGAAVYLRATKKDKTISTQLLCAKSRIAPLKKLTIPRLELCAAVLGAELTNRVRMDLNYTNIPVYFWSDSEIVLSWIQSPSSTLHTFVANRISKIQQISNPEQWHHVSSKENPADILSRGTTPGKLKSCAAWFHGPLFLYGNKQGWLQAGKKIPEPDTDIERKTKRVVAITHHYSDLETMINNIEHKNSFTFLQNCVGYLRRPFVRPRPQNCALSPVELREALLIIVRALQLAEFRQELKDLNKHKAVANDSTIRALAPFIDNSGILRVGGRLEESTISYDAKHPILIPYHSDIVKLLFKQKHEENNHCGPLTLLAIMRQSFWPMKGKIMARNIVHNCVRCSKAKPKLMTQIMGNLPADRVTMARPFLKSGVDYCGPFKVHYRIRGKQPTKAYLAVFCCFATKAVHLELVTDLTTNGFLGALNRFTGRRGRCQVLYSDNATNFVGAKNQLAELENAIQSGDSQHKIMRECSKQGIEFRFIPPRAPHFGGLWEAAVKSAKYLLLRTVSDASLTYEELETVVIGVEAILNSRPLTPMSSNPNDLSAITPGHFLIGEPLTAIPDPHAKQSKMSLAARLELVSYLKHQFWTRWSNEYLSELQFRHKWKQESQNLKEGDMVIIKDDNQPSMKWPLGRVQRVFRNENDGRVRVADIKTSTGISRRAIHSLAPLPIESGLQSELSSMTSQQNVGNLDEGQPSKTLNISTPLDRTRKTSAPDNNTIPRKISRIQPNLLIALLALMLIPLALCNPLSEHKFPNKPGLYFENIGTVTRITADWKIITYFDLSPIRKEIEIFRNGTTELRNLCSMMTQGNMCRELVNKFDNINLELQSDDQMTRKRKARAALDIIGNIANKLFGVLDSEYAENMSKTINELRDNDNMLLKLIKNQTSVIDSTLNILTQETEAIVLKVEAIQHQMDNISQENFMFSHRLEIYTSLSAQLSLLSVRLQRMEEAIFNTLTDAQHGKINPLLLSPKQLESEIAKIKSHLPTSVHLPFNQDDVIHLYSLMTTQSGISSDHIIFVSTLPLSSNERFDLFQITPIPAIINNTLLTIHPDSSYIAVTPLRDQYFTLTKDELQTCTEAKFNANQFLCPNKPLKYHQGAQQFLCEINLFTNTTDDSCVYYELKTEVIWSPLHHANQWIITSKHKTQLTVACTDTTKLLEHQGSSLLQIQDDCTLKHQTVTINAHKTYTDTIYESYAAFGDMGSINQSVSRPIISRSPIDLNHELQQLKQLHEDIKQAEIIDLPSKIHKTDIHQYAASYGTLFIMISFILWTTCKLKQRKHTAKIIPDATPSPKPRFSVDPQLTV